MKIQILDRAKKKKFLAGIREFGVEKISQTLIRTGKDRIRGYSGDLNTEQLWDLWRLLPIEGIGLYVGKDMINRNGVRDVRISIDGLHTWKKQIKNKIIELTKEQEEEWFKGKNIELGKEKSKMEGFVVIKSHDSKDFIGTGKIGDGGQTIYNFLPKERRRKSNTF